MGEVYSNAILNISAAAAKSPHDGLFMNRVATLAVVIDGHAYLLFSEQKLSNHYLAFADPTHSSIFSRAWCMQERVLCPRILHLCQSSVSWECETITFATDTMPIEHSPKTRDPTLAPRFALKKDHGIRSGDHGSIHMSEWSDMVNT